MLGGRSSFGAGGWAGTELAGILPVNIGPDDGQIEPATRGSRSSPTRSGLENFVLRLGPERRRDRADLGRPAADHRGQPVRPAQAAPRSSWPGPGRDPLMVGMDNVGKGRVLAFGGETWPWARSLDDQGRLAHAKFWRQAILWLAHKEDQGESQVKLKLDARRVAAGQKLDLTATARDAKNEPIPDASYETTVTRLDADGKPEGKPEPVPLYPQGDDAKGAYFANGQPGEYLVTVKGTEPGKEIGSDPARFMVYQDDRELENPAADLALLKQIAEITGGASAPLRGAGQAPQGPRPRGLRVRHPDRAPALGQLALLPDLRRPADRPNGPSARRRAGSEGAGDVDRGSRDRLSQLVVGLIWRPGMAVRAIPVLRAISRLTRFMNEVTLPHRGSLPVRPDARASAWTLPR